MCGPAVLAASNKHNNAKQDLSVCKLCQSLAPQAALRKVPAVVNCSHVGLSI